MNENMSKDPKKSTFLTDILLAIGVVVISIIGYQSYSQLSSDKPVVVTNTESPQKVMKYGFDTGENFFDFVKIKRNQYLSDILQYEGISYLDVTKIEKASKDIYSTRRFKSGKKLTFVRPDSCTTPTHFIYEPDVFRYVVYDMSDSLSVEIVEREFQECTEIATGKIETSLWDALKDNGHSALLIDKMEDALASQVDFYHTKKGDEFKIIYERKYINEKPVAIGDIIGAVYSNKAGEHYSFHYENGKFDGYYDYDGRAAKGAFLRAPVKYSRISSQYSLSRYHPIKKRRIPHYGTDFAAPRGTPIMAVADGVVSKASYTRGNGKYVKIKHSKKYQTQYLHMSRFADGIRPGTSVKQGQHIGYVGSTGLATGPHVCFRFWKDGKQIDHRREVFPEAEPMDEAEIPLFNQHRDVIYRYLTNIDPQFSKNNASIASESSEKKP